MREEIHDPAQFMPAVYNGPPAPDGVVWHYCRASKAKLILADGALLPHTQHAGAKPLLWASTNHVWEPTACKPLPGQTWTHQGRQVPQCLTFAGMQSFGSKLVRFALPEGLLPYTFLEACAQARMDTRVRRMLLEAGKALGADPDHWRATRLPIAHEAWLAIELWQVDHWQEVLA